MIKRRSTLENSEKSKKNKITEYLLELDRCIQIPNDDKLVIRKKIKDNEEDVITLFQIHKKDKNYHDLQIKLRKMIQIQKNHEKRYTINHVDRDRKKSEYNQRVYSQNSQSASIKNSIKESPEKQENKKTMITFDICELKRKMEECSQGENKIHYHLDNSKSKNQLRINSISRINTSLNKSRQNSFDRLPLKQQKSQFVGNNININPSKGKLMNAIKQNSSKITLRITQKKSPSKQNIQKKYQKIQEVPHVMPHMQQKPTQQSVNVEISYSSSIKNLLMSKLKDHKEIKRQKIILKDNKKYDENLISNRSISDFNDQTAIKRSAKPMIRDQIVQYPKHFDQSYDKFPMYIQTTQQSEDQRKTEKKLQDFGYKNKNSKVRVQKLQTLMSLQTEQKYGQFYMKIKNIIDSKNY